MSMSINAKMSTTRIEAVSHQASRQISRLEGQLPAQPYLAREYHEAYATWHQCNALLAARRDDKGSELGGMKWHQSHAVRHMKLAGDRA